MKDHTKKFLRSLYSTEFSLGVLGSGAAGLAAGATTESRELMTFGISCAVASFLLVIISTVIRRITND